MMKYIVFIFSLLAIVSCNNSNKLDSAGAENSDKDSKVVLFDSIRAAKLGADDYGMHQYVMALLKKGPNRERTEEEEKKLQAAHMQNIGRLAEEGKLVLAGPFLNDGELRGIYIFDVKTVEEAKVLVETDPAIKEGSLEMELIPWYGSAALMEVGEIHEAISKIKM